MTTRPIGPWRLAAQWAASLGILLTPFVRVGGDSLLRIDLSARSLVLLGTSHPLEQMFLLLLFCLALVCSFLLATVVFGRVWCGWACPQTALTDLTDAAARWLRVDDARRAGSGRGRVAALHGLYGSLSLLVGANLVWYFVSPPEFFRLLATGTLPAPALATLSVIAGAVYIDLALVRRNVCRELCPYGRFQMALADAGTLALRLAPEDAARCLDCQACVRVCPTGLDIREGKQGQQVECIQCGRCRDACAAILGRRGEAGLLRYGFEGGVRALLRARTVLLVAAILGSVTALSVAAARWDPVSLTARRSTAPNRVLPDGRTAAFFSLDAANRGTRPVVAASLEALLAEDVRVELRGGPTSVSLAGGERARLQVAALLPPANPAAVTFRLRDARGRVLAETRGGAR